MQMVQPPVGGFPQGSPMVAGPPPTQTTPTRPLLQQPLLHDNRPPGTGDSPAMMPPASVVNMTPNPSNVQGGMTVPGSIAAPGGMISQPSVLQGGVMNQGSAIGQGGGTSQSNLASQGGMATQGGVASQGAAALSTSTPSEPAAATATTTTSTSTVGEKKSEEVKKKKRRKKKVHSIGPYGYKFLRDVNFTKYMNEALFVKFNNWNI